MALVTRKRHIVKTLSWRIIGSIDTMFIGWFVSGDLTVGMSIGFIEFFTKIVLYYLHERAWYRLTNFPGKSKLRHLLKTISWRLVGTMDTVILGWIVTGNPLSGLHIGSIELFTKMLLYYIHEELWYRSSFGIERNDV